MQFRDLYQKVVTVSEKSQKNKIFEVEIENSMKITFVFDGLQFGGIERVGIEYIKLLTDRDYIVDVVNLRPKLNAMEKEIPSSVEVLHLSYPRNLAPQRYSKLIRSIPFGFIMFNVCAFPIDVIQKFYKIGYRKRLPNTDIAIAFSGHYNDLTFVSENFKSKKRIAWLHGDETSYNDIAPGYFELYKKIKNLICLSEKNDDKSDNFNKKYGINKTLIYNPINLSNRIIDKKVVENLKQTYGDFILMVGRMAKDKDQSTLIRALLCLQEEYGLKKKMVLVGDGPERLALEELVKKIGLENQVYFAGARYDVQNYYMAASVYAHSSPAEGLPTVLLEAMYYGVPIASTNSEPGVPEILQENCGLITPVGDSKALANSIYNLYTNRKLVNRLNINSQRRIQDFSPENVLIQFEKFIKTLK